MAKTLRTSGDYTIKAGPSGSAGDKIITLDAADVRIPGNLIVDGATTYVETTNLKIEDSIIILNKNNSGAVDIDAGIMIERGASGNNAAIYWNEGDDVFKAVLTTSGHDATSISDTTLAKIRVGAPASGDDAATKDYVDIAISAAGTMSSFNVSDGVSADTIIDAETINLVGGPNIQTLLDAGSNTITIDVKQNLTNINSVSTGSSNADLVLVSNGTGSVAINNILTFSSNASTPTATAITKMYSKTTSGGGTGVFFVNSTVDSGTEGELISKKKARALAIALGG
jgi:hypothetical protein